VDIIPIEFSLRSIITDTTDRYGPIITVGGVGGDFSHTASSSLLNVINIQKWSGFVGGSMLGD